MHHQSGLKRLAALISSLLIAACGGGGGSESSNPGSGASSSASSSSASSSSTASSASSSSSQASSSSSSAQTSSASSARVSLSFSATDAEFANPERGFYRWAWTDLEKLAAADLQDAYANGYRIVYAMLRLDAYRSTPLPASLLSQLDASAALARTHGVKLLVRAVYNYPASETEYQNAQDATLTQTLAHIAQLKPFFHTNADVIAHVQAGFIGAWGEWHTSPNNLTASASRTQIKDALLDAVPANRFLQFRYPPHLMAWTPTLPGLDAALQGNYRLGVHNDCFLASQTDVGTYASNASTRATQQNYVAALGQLAPFGGETCNPADESGAQPRTSCADILTEGAKYRLSYLNNDYYRDLFHTNWSANGCMAEVKRRMGYRLRFVNASHPQALARGERLEMTLTVRNDGWARVFNPRALQIVLRERNTGTVRRLQTSGADPRSWLPGEELLASFSATLPADLPGGRHEVLLALPDPAGTLTADARFAIRPANADDSSRAQGWSASLGAFALGSELEVR